MGMKDFISENQPFTYHMQAAPFQLGNYPQIERLWESKLEKIDRQIVDFYRGSDDIGEGLPQLQWGVTDWLGCQELDGPARAEFRELSQDPAFVRIRLEERIAYLVAAGKLGPAARQLAPGLRPKSLPVAGRKRPTEIRPRLSVNSEQA